MVKNIWQVTEAEAMQLRLAKLVTVIPTHGQTDDDIKCSNLKRHGDGLSA